MQGLLRTRPTLANADLSQLRKSVVWSSQPNPAAAASTASLRKGALQERLEELLVLELHKDGGRAFLNFTVRGLYKHVLSAITSKISGKRERDEVRYMIERKGRTTTFGEAGAAATTTSLPTVVLGSLSAHRESEHEDHTASSVATNNDENINDTLDSQTERTQQELAPVPTTTTVEVPPEIPSPQPNIQPINSSAGNDGGGDDREVHPARAEKISYRERLGGYLYVGRLVLLGFYLSMN